MASFKIWGLWGSRMNKWGPWWWKVGVIGPTQLLTKAGLLPVGQTAQSLLVMGSPVYLSIAAPIVVVISLICVLFDWNLSVPDYKLHEGRTLFDFCSPYIPIIYHGVRVHRQLLNVCYFLFHKTVGKSMCMQKHFVSSKSGPITILGVFTLSSIKFWFL